MHTTCGDSFDPLYLFPCTFPSQATSCRPTRRQRELVPLPADALPLHTQEPSPPRARLRSSGERRCSSLPPPCPDGAISPKIGRRGLTFRRPTSLAATCSLALLALARTFPGNFSHRSQRHALVYGNYPVLLTQSLCN